MRRWDSRMPASARSGSASGPGASVLGALLRGKGTDTKLPIIDAIGVSGQLPSSDVPSAGQVTARLANVALRPGIEVPHGPVLLLDALYRTGWTMTVAAALLREAGATAVLPLVVHQLP